RGKKYLTLRIRCYGNSTGKVYALSVKTEDQKWRAEIDADLAEFALAQGFDPRAFDLPADLVARLQALAGDEPFEPVVTIGACRFSVEDERDRLTLDTAVGTDTGKRLPFGVLEFKSTAGDATPPQELRALGLRRVKISKFLWATEV